MTSTHRPVQQAQKLAQDQPQQAEALYKEILQTQPGQNEAAVRDFELALTGLGELYRDQKRTQDVADLVRQTRSVLSSFAKAKTAKLGVY